MKSVWNDVDQSDTTRLKAIHRIVTEGFLHTYPDSSFYYAKLQYDFAEGVGNKLFMSRALNIQSFAYLFQGDYPGFIEIQRRILEVSIERRDSLKISKTYNNIGGAYEMLGDYVNAIDYLVKSLVIKEALGEQEAIASALSNIGIAYMGLNQHEEAEEYFQRTMDIRREIQDSVGIGMAYTNLGLIDYKKGRLDKAFDNLTLSLKILRQKNRETDALESIHYLGKIHLDKGNLELALEYFQKAESMNRSVDSFHEITLSTNYIGVVYKKQGDEAKKAGSSMLAREKYNKALNKSTTALNIGIKQNDFNIIKESSKALYELNELMGKYEQALEMHKSYIAYRDSIENQENRDKLARVDFQYDYEKKKLADDLVHEAELKRESDQRIMLYAILGVFILFSGIIYFAWRKRKQLSEDLEASYTKQKELGKYKDSMTAMINHDLRTPLTLINGYITRILENEDNYLTKASEKDLRNLESNSLKLIEMSEEIQELLLLDEGKLKLQYVEVDMDNYLQVMTGMFASAASDSNINLIYRSSDLDGLKVRLDQKHFDKVIYNLLINALHHTASGGEIELGLEEASDNRCRITIKDSGAGIPPEELPLIFDRLYRSEDQSHKVVFHKGYGIGLAVVKELVELHGGTVEVSSEVGVGTVFRIDLPDNIDKELSGAPVLGRTSGLSKSKIKKMVTPEGMIGKVDSTKPTILIVDDQEEIRSFIAELINDEYAIKQAANGREALILLKREKVDLIITDLMMPWLDGFGLIEEFKKSEKLENIPVMVISARTTEEDRLRILDQGVNNFIGKPFHSGELKKRISNLLADKPGSTWDEIVKDKDVLSNVEQDILIKLNQIILERIDDSSLTIEVIAQELNSSRSKAINLVKSLTGMTPLNYIKSIRMEYIERLIKTDKVKNSSEAAKAIGMTNPTQFSNQYKKHFGNKPF